MKDLKTLKQVAEWIREEGKRIVVMYAFNATGKTRLSVEFKELMRDPKTRRQTGIYYNAFSEDLFAWDNDMSHAEKEMRLRVVPSSLNHLHREIDEGKIRSLLAPYHVNYDFRFKWINNDQNSGIDYIRFFKMEEPDKNIKISRGEERLFVWNFFMALFLEENGHLGENNYFFIDDPVSSLDDNNLFITASLLVKLMKDNFKDSRIIVTTHHMSFFSTLTSLMKNSDSDELKYTEYTDEKGNKQKKLDAKYDIKFLERVGEQYVIKGNSSGFLQYHLMLLQKLKTLDEDEIIPLHFVQLRQILELISSFQGKGNFSRALGTAHVDSWHGINVADRVNSLSHQRVYERAYPVVSPQDREMLHDVVDALIKTFNFSVK